MAKQLVKDQFGDIVEAIKTSSPSTCKYKLCPTCFDKLPLTEPGVHTCSCGESEVRISQNGHRIRY